MITFFSQNSEHERRPPGQLLCSNKTQTLHFTLKLVLEKRQDGSDIYYTCQTSRVSFLNAWCFSGNFRVVASIAFSSCNASTAALFDNNEFRSRLSRSTGAAEVCSICIFMLLLVLSDHCSEKPKAAFGPVLVFFTSAVALCLGDVNRLRQCRWERESHVPSSSKVPLYIHALPS